MRVLHARARETCSAAMAGTDVHNHNFLCDFNGLTFSDDGKYLACTCACAGMTYIVILRNVAEARLCKWVEHSVFPLTGFLFEPPRVTFRSGTHTVYTTVPMHPRQANQVRAYTISDDKVECTATVDLTSGRSNLNFLVVLPGNTWEMLQVDVKDHSVLVENKHKDTRRRRDVPLCDVESCTYVSGIGTVAVDMIDDRHYRMARLVVIDGFHDASSVHMAWTCSVVRCLQMRP
jgi:hypothetical protein